ncbi:MAG: extracellular solute-binding protein [Saccharothrix sp.]|nr:extracellular solute-binding protein [Saccharothrix sp.]
MRTIRLPGRLAITAAVCALILTGCAKDDDTDAAAAGNTDVTLPAPLMTAAEQAAGAAADGRKPGGSITVVGVNGGAEGKIIEESFKPFTKATGIKVQYTGTQDLATIVQTRVQAGNPMDVVIDVSAGQMLEYAKQGKAIPLDGMLDMAKTKAEFPEGLLNGASLDGRLYGLWSEVDNFMVWYNPKAYQGPKTPATWDELQTWAKSSADAGNEPWCMALEGGATSGWPGTYFIENLFLGKYGPDKLTEWGTGKLPWTSPEVKWAFEQFGAITNNPKMVKGGGTAVVSTNFLKTGSGLYDAKPQCALVGSGNYAGGLILMQNPGKKAGEDIDFFAYPPSDPQYAGKQLAAGHVSYALKDTPQVKAFMRYQASAEYQALLAASGQWAVANNKVGTEVYPNPLIQKSAEQIKQSGDISVGPAFRQPAAVVQAFNKAVVSYVQNPSSLDSILSGLDKVRTASN